MSFGLKAKLLIAVGLLSFSVNTGAQEVDNPYGENDLLAMPRASKVHDRVTFMIDEESTAKNEATTDTTKETSAKWNFSNFFKITKDKDGDLIAKAANTNRLPNLDLSTAREHSGDGETEAKNSIQTEISGEVIEVMPNGHLVVEAKSSITVNNEERQVVFTGRVDPSDLESDNSIDAKYVIDKTVKFIGKGDISDAVKRGWLAKAFDFLSPF